MATDEDNAEGFDLTGVWQGLFSYPPNRGREPVSFVATLAELNGWLNGAIEETGTDGPAAGQTLTATIQGRRSGRSVAFLKLYDGGHRSYDTVSYEGEVSGDGTEIEGRWTVPGSWSGNFLMIRSGAEAKAHEREASQKV